MALELLRQELYFPPKCGAQPENYTVPALVQSELLVGNC